MFYDIREEMEGVRVYLNQHLHPLRLRTPPIRLDREKIAIVGSLKSAPSTVDMYIERYGMPNLYTTWKNSHYISPATSLEDLAKNFADWLAKTPENEIEERVKLVYTLRI